MRNYKVILSIIAFASLVTTTSCQKETYPDLGDGLFAEIVTSKGTMVAKLTYDKTPVTVANFVALAEGTHPMVTDSLKGKPFYNGLIFHRVMDKFMIQGGDPMGSGMGGPGYKFDDEFDETLKHDKPGVLSMANSGPGGTNGSQFFILETPKPHLDNVHSVFGQLVVGLEVHDSISNVEVTRGNNRPVEPVVIEQINIIRQGFDANKFDAVNTWNTEAPKLKEKRIKAQEEARKKAEEKRRFAEEKSAEAAEKFLPTLESYKKSAKTLASGLMKHTITKGNGEKVQVGDNAKVYYEGYFTDGKLLDSNRKDIELTYGKDPSIKEQRGLYNPMPVKFSPDNTGLIAGFKEAVGTLQIGEKAYFFIPSHLAYGETGRGLVKPNTDLIFILELVEIAK